MPEEHTAYELTTDLLCLEEVAARREKEGKQEAANLLRAAALLLTKTARIAALEAEKEQEVLAEHGGCDLLIELRSMLKETGVDACQRGSSNDKLYKRIDKAIRARAGGKEGE